MIAFHPKKKETKSVADVIQLMKKLRKGVKLGQKLSIKKNDC